MTARPCIECPRKALPHNARCNSCHAALIARLLGRTAEYPVR